MTHRRIKVSNQPRSGLIGNLDLESGDAKPLFASLVAHQGKYTRPKPMNNYSVGIRQGLLDAVFIESFNSIKN